MSMTKEQEEAIEIIDKMIKSYIEADECGLSNNDFKNEIRAMQTVLNMLKEKDKEIEKLKKHNKELLRKLRNRVKEVKKLNKYSLYKTEFKTLNEQLTKQEHANWIGLSNQSAIEHLIKAYKELEENKELLEVRVSSSAHNRIIELEEENKKLKANLEIINKEYESTSEQLRCEILNNNSIPVSLVEEKIEELDKKEQELQNSISDEEREEYSDANISFELMDIEIRRSLLQELLEKRK